MIMRGLTGQFRKPDKNEGGKLLFPRRKDNVQLLTGSIPVPRLITALENALTQLTLQRMVNGNQRIREDEQVITELIDLLKEGYGNGK